MFEFSVNYRRFVMKTLKAALEEGILVKDISPHRYRINPNQRVPLFEKWKTKCMYPLIEIGV
jgi:hypothetical protein